MQLLLLAVLALFASGASGASAEPIHIAIVGDSTVADYKLDDSHRGWGQLLPEFVDASRATVQNFAANGRSTKTFLSEGRWDKVLAAKPDYIFIQFGHNDSHAPDKPESTDAATDFAANLRTYVEGARGVGATPVLVTPMHRGKRSKDGHLSQELAPYAAAVRSVAQEKNVPLIDLFSLSEKSFEAMDDAHLHALFALPETDLTHFNATGARLLAQMVAGETARLVPALQTVIKLSFSPERNRLTTLWLIGDSTVRNGAGDGANGQWGWGEPIGAFFDAAKIRVVNRARGGRSSRTFQTEGLWDQVLQELQPGDRVLMQFGHNDAAAINDETRAKGTIPGLGEETQEIENLLTKKHEVVHTYGWYMRKFIADTRAKGAIPIVLSPVPRLRWTPEGKIVRNLDNYSTLAEGVARAQGTAYVDLNAIIADRYDTMSREQVEALFHGDGTHTGAEGAEINAASVVAGLKGLKDALLSAALSVKGQAVTPSALVEAAAG